MHIDELPDELLELILGHVEPWELRRGVAGVSRRWAAAARRRAPAVRSVRELRELRAGLRALLVPAGLEGFHVKTLLARTAQLAPHLAALTLHAGVRLSCNHVVVLAHLLPHLRHLDVFLEPHLSTPSTLSKLQSIVINHRIVPNHKTLEKYPLRAIHMFGESQHFPSLLPLLHARRDHLTELTLRCAEMRDRTFEAVGACRNLVVLQLYSCWLMTGAGACAATRPPRLRRLHVSGAVMLRRAALAEVLAGLPRGLEELALSGSSLGDEHAAALAARLPRLAVLEAWDCALSAEGALRLAAALPRLLVLDLNRPLAACHVTALRRHPALEFVRYLPEDAENKAPSVDDLKENPLKLTDAGNAVIPGPSGAGEPAPRALRLESAAARFPRDYFRGDGAGFRGKLLYYWTPPLQLRPGAPRRAVAGDCDF